MTIHCKGNLISLKRPKIMGILNITPDSFYDGGKYKSDKDFLAQTEKMLQEGATFIDLGAYSSRPGAQNISESEESQRLLPIVSLILKHFPDALLSIDTFRSNIARNAVEAGAAMINDISAASLDPQMLDTIAQLQVPYIMMHMQGTPQNMQQNPTYQDVLIDINHYFSEKVRQARQKHIHDIIIDPGFGFGKTIDHNFELLHKMELLHFHEAPILVGISRKSMIYKTLNSTPTEAGNGTTALHSFVLQKGANILRVHDVKEAQECVTLWGKLQEYN
ncbi:MAG: dihydropteroate synthase [Flavobacteriaceae bacterium]|nr:dihydropteroate synthase [Flavobacteriaceae bacterium]